MLDNSNDLEQNLIDIDKFQINGYQKVKRVVTGSLWNVLIAENNGSLIIVKQINQKSIHDDDEIEKNVIICKQLRAYQFF